jgi:ferritin-like metal-binding protein YciE
MAMNTFQELFVDQLRDLHSAEKQLVQALPKMADAASTRELKSAFTQHLEQTKGHQQQLEQIFKQLGERAGGKTCKAMEGLIQEGQEVIKEKGDPKVKDAALIAAAQRVEHYEIAGYGTVRTYAQELGLNEAVDTLQHILEEESAANKLLTELAIGQGTKPAVNEQAIAHSR